MKKFLIVDDIFANRMLLSEIVEQLGYQADEAENGKEAVQKISQGGVDIVLMDVEMPVMNGIEATRHIRHQLPFPLNKTMILGVTAHDPVQFFEDYKDVGFDGFITKPYTTDRVKVALTKLIV